MKLVAFYPSCYNVPTELLAAKVPAGLVTESDWREALSDRLIDLALNEPNPEKSAEWACLALDRSDGIDHPNQIAQFLFEGNSNFQTLINLSVFDVDPEDYFPLEVIKDDLSALEAINDTDLFYWVLTAAYFIGGDTLDAFLKYEHQFP